MNRVIKFRVWDIKMKMWINNIGMSKNNILSHGDSKRFHIMQFTGLTDKNGIEIFEGDKLKDKYNSVGTVEYLNDFGGFVSVIEHPDRKIFIQLDQRRNKFEVIGNIHEKKN